MRRDDSIGLRRATILDVEPLARGVLEGWTAPPSKRPASAASPSLRLFVAAGQARARRFYEREGWLPAGDPFDDPTPGIEMIECRCTLTDR